MSLNPTLINTLFPYRPDRPLWIDNFAGGGGASTGIEDGSGQYIHIAVNHSPSAIRMHMANHPMTAHFCESVYDIDPIAVTNGNDVAFAWFSPDCTHFSKAKGAVPRSQAIRGLSWIILRWAALKRPYTIAMENVEEIQGWGPLTDDGNPDPRRTGETFEAFKLALTTGLDPEHPANDEILQTLGTDFPLHMIHEGLGYQLDHRELRACDYGAPTTRKRFILVARADGRPIQWPAPTHALPTSLAVQTGKLQPFKTAADCIDWTHTGHSIFLNATAARAAGVRRPLSPNTLHRIARGVRRHILDNATPFIAPTNNTIAATIVKHYGGNYTGYGAPLTDPLHTITATDHHALVTAILVKYYGNDKCGVPVTDPLHTITTRDRMALVSVIAEPLQNLAPNTALEQFATDYLDGHDLTLTIDGQRYRVIDIRMRMLKPRELYRAQGFPTDYKIGDHPDDGFTLTTEQQVRMVGNSVPPALAAAIAKANLPDFKTQQRAA